MISNCQVCESRPAQYKCITCRIRFCSADCCKTHKFSDSCRSPASKALDNCQETDRRYDTVDSVAPEALARLASSSELVKLVGDSELRETLRAVDGSSDGAAAVRQAMSSEKFQAFVDQCLSLVSDSC